MAAIKTGQAAWFKHWFDSSYYHHLYGHRDENEAIGFIDALLKELQPHPRSRMMDLGCGAGRHAKYLASKGYDVTGTDLASSSIRSAKRSEKPGLRFYRHDMRMPFGEAQFDTLFNFFTSFGYFKSAGENHDVMRNISRSLKPGGVLVIDYLNVDYSEDRLIPEEEKEIDGIVYRINRWTDDQFFYKNIAIDDQQAGESFEFCEQVSKFHVQDFEWFFERHGLTLGSIYGDYALNGYDAGSSPRLILVAHKNN